MVTLKYIKILVFIHMMFMIRVQCNTCFSGQFPIVLGDGITSDFKINFI
jgi:hypothetical protein